MTAPLKPTVEPVEAVTTLPLEFDDNALVLQLFGSHHGNLARIEQKLGVLIDTHGNEVTITGAPETVDAARAVLDGLYGRLAKGLAVGREEVDAALRMAAGDAPGDASRDVDAELVIRTRKRHISPRSPVQAAYIRAIDAFELVFALGPAGTGKTYLAVAKAVEKLVNGEVDRIVLSRPAVEAGERLGFLPGDMRDKVNPYLRPLYDALYDMMPAPQVAKRLESGEIEIAPLAFMRGRTLANAFVILDEAQNTTAVQMKMFLTRLGENSRMIVTGDLSQVDLPRSTRSGLRAAVEILEGIEGGACVEFTHADVVRHPLVTRIVRAYEEFEARHGSAACYEASGDGDASQKE
ncbi:MAG: PhoH family protein [Rhodospirillales bacterium]|nr:PhoH family protein [Rhodospirillales bacterium]